MVYLVDKKTVDEAMSFLAEKLAMVQSLALREEQFMVAILVDAIL